MTRIRNVGYGFSPHLPAFDVHGNLPDGHYAPTYRAFYERFVDGFTKRTTTGNALHGGRSHARTRAFAHSIGKYGGAGTFTGSLKRVTRDQIAAEWNELRQSLISAGIDVEADQIVVGSYVTAREFPNDIDFILELPLDTDLVGVPLCLEIQNHPAILFLESYRPPHNYCHVFAVPSLPDDHPERPTITVNLLKSHFAFFRRDQNNAKRGFVWLGLGERNGA